MAVQLISDRLIHDLQRSLSPTTSLTPDPIAPAPPASSPIPSLTGLLLSEVPSTPLRWLWPGRIPLGHLTLLEAAPDSGLSLLALTLAACVSSGSPLPDGTPIQQGHVILFAPYDSACDTLKTRLEAAGGDPAYVTLLRPPIANTSSRPKRTRSRAPLFDLDHLATTIRQRDARLVILDPASAIPALARSLPALIELAQQTGCAILLTRSLRRAPVNPLRFSGPTTLLREAVRSRLLLTPHPGDERQHLLLCSHHPLCTQPSILAYDIRSSQENLPIIHWLAEQDRSQLERLCTGPLRSPHRLAILRFLQQSSTAHPIPDILSATCYDYEAGRKMLLRMKMAGELVSTARGLYTTATHPCLLHPTDDPSTASVPNVPTVPDMPSAFVSNVPTVPAMPSTAVPNVPTVPAMPSTAVPNVPSSLRPPLGEEHTRRSPRKRHHKRH